MTDQPQTTASIFDTIKARSLPDGVTLSDYWRAPSGQGPLSAEWADKPHRLLYDLIAALMFGGHERAE